jgi:type IV pilus assembly protein PilM
MLKGVEKSVTGLEISAAYVAAAKTKGSGRHVDLAGIRPLRDGIVREGEVVDPQSLAEGLHELFSETKLPRIVRIGITSQNTVMRVVELPPGIDKRDVGEAIRFQMPETIPLPAEDVVFSHELLGMIDTPAGPRTRIAVVAARRHMIDDLLVAVRGAGLKPVGVDLSAFALIRWLYRAADAGSPVAYLGIGGLAHLSVATDGICVFSRALSSGEDQMASQLLGRIGIARDRAHEVLVEMGVGAPVTSSSSAASDAEDPLVRTVSETISSGAARIADEVRDTLEFYVNQDRGVSPSKLVVSGPGVSLPGLTEQLRDQLALPVETRIAGDAPFGLDPAILQVPIGLTTTEPLQ